MIKAEALVELGEFGAIVEHLVLICVGRGDAGDAAIVERSAIRPRPTRCDFARTRRSSGTLNAGLADVAFDVPHRSVITT